VVTARRRFVPSVVPAPRGAHRQTLLAAALVCAVVAGRAPVASAAEADGFVPIFNGTSLDGWEGKGEFWSVADGAIVGQTTAEKPTKGNTFLIWRGGQPGDFELRLKFRLADVGSGNSGVQYRSQELDGFVVGGYQADMDLGNSYTGILYEERGRGIIGARGKKTEIKADGKVEVVGTLDDEKALLASLKRGDWNEYTIIAKGNALIQRINGFTSMELTDNQEAKRRLDGVIAFQLHAGPPMLVQFRDIRIRCDK
jgi:hypothetical protein